MTPQNTRNVRVFIVEDSPTMRELLSHIFESTPGMEVAGFASDGREAVEAIPQLRPDVVTMDINMPHMNGFEATRAIMEGSPTPIVIVSGSWDPSEVRTTFAAMEAGALAVVAKPPGIDHPAFPAAAQEIVTVSRLMSEVKVVRRWPSKGAVATPPPPETDRLPHEISAVAIGASTGGPLVIDSILRRLPGNLPFPILIVQHMAVGFIDGFVEWLHRSSGFPVEKAVHGAQPRPGCAYVAADGHHLGLSPDRRIALSKEEAFNGLRPSVDHLFRSVMACHGRRTMAILLTGMGIDGAHAMKEVSNSGGVTIAQDKPSCVVYGMPGEAVRIGAAQKILAPDEIAGQIARFADSMRRARKE